MDSPPPRFRLVARDPADEFWVSIALDDGAPTDLRRLAEGAAETPVMGAAGYAACLHYLLHHHGKTEMVRTIPL